MVPASMSQLNWEGIELGSVRSAWLYLVLNPIIHTYTQAHTRHASGATECNLHRQRHLLGTQEVFDKSSHMHTHTRRGLPPLT